MKKILIVSTVSRQFYLFEQGNIEVLKSLGYEVHGAANFEDANERLDALEIIRHPFDIQRSPFSLRNIRAYKQLKKIIYEQKFDLIHCHSPMGGFLTRLVGKALGLKNILYTAHGFHFYKGAPIFNWLAYYPIERWLSKYTALLITINTEDFKRAKTFKTCRVEHIAGIGINLEGLNKNKFLKQEKRKALSIHEDTNIILSVGELNKNKNHEIIIKALSKITHKDFVYVICGQGELDEYLSILIKDLNLENKVKLLGFRDDINEICLSADLFVFPSRREGLSVSLMEAMATGLPIIASKIRGNTDLIVENEGGFLVSKEDINEYAYLINKIISDKDIKKRLALFNIKRSKFYNKENIKFEMKRIYSEVNLNG